MTNDLQQAISHVLQQDSKIFENLMSKLKQLKDLQYLFIKYVDPKIAKYCQVANFTEGSLVILTESALWSTQLRFQIPELLSNLRKHPEFCHLKHIQCKIRPSNKSNSEQERKRKVCALTEETARFIEESASTIKHPKLKAVMRKIAKNIESVNPIKT